MFNCILNSRTATSVDLAVREDCCERVFAEAEQKGVMKRSSLDDINVVEILDRVLDKGIVVEPWVRVYLIGNELHASKGRMIIESLRTHL